MLRDLGGRASGAGVGRDFFGVDAAFWPESLFELDWGGHGYSMLNPAKMGKLAIQSGGVVGLELPTLETRPPCCFQIDLHDITLPTPILPFFS